MIPKFIMIHHSATPDGSTFSWKAIEGYHTSWRYDGNIITSQQAVEYKKQGKNVEAPWLDIGYHFGLENIDGRITGLIGRSLDMSGAHCSQSDMNSKAIGICMVGNYDLLVPPPEMINYLIRYFLRPLTRLLQIPKENIIFHREFAPKTCPGTKFDKKSLLTRI